MSKKNAYQRKAEKKGILGAITHELDTEKNIKNSAIETGKDIVAGAVGGGLLGALFGKASLVAGTFVTGLGHWTNNRWLTSLGVGMMASGGFQKGAAMNGADDKKQTLAEGIKERTMSFKDSLTERLFLDKLLKSKKGEKKDESTNGMGEVNYYTSPNQKEIEGTTAKELDMKALDQIEQQISESANQYAQVNGMNDLDPQERNF